MSIQSNQIHNLLLELFPHNVIFTEYSIWFKGTRLFFDFFVKELRLFIEVQGQQHYKYTRHFHGDISGFIASKKRDNLKIEYCEKNEFDLVKIDFDDKVETIEDLLLILKSNLG
jgi:hypothetical protein